MAHGFSNRVWADTATTGTGNVTIGSAKPAHCTPGQAGTQDGDERTWLLEEGNDFEIFRGAYVASGSVVTRGTVLLSQIAGSTGTTRMTLAGSATIREIAAAEDLLSIVDKADARAALGATTVGDAVFTAADAAEAREVIGVPKGHIYGLTLSNNSTDATNDIDIAAGECADEDGNLMVLSSGITLRSDVNVAGGGDLDTGSVTDDTYHAFIIQRSDNGDVRGLLSANPNTPTMPTNYDRKRRIWSIVRASGAIRPFRQTGDYCELVTPVTDINTTTLGTSKGNYLMSAPIGISPILRIAATIRNTSSSVGVRVFATDISSGAQPYSIIAPAMNYYAAGHFDIRADVDGYISAQADVASTTLQASLLGWTDHRGRL